MNVKGDHWNQPKVARRTSTSLQETLRQAQATMWSFNRRFHTALRSIAPVFPHGPGPSGIQHVPLMSTQSQYFDALFSGALQSSPDLPVSTQQNILYLSPGSPIFSPSAAASFYQGHDVSMPCTVYYRLWDWSILVESSSKEWISLEYGLWPKARPILSSNLGGRKLNAAT